MIQRVSLGLLSAFALVTVVLVSTPAAEARPRSRVARPLVVTRTAQVEVLWGSKWWKAAIIGKRAGFTKIHYVGWSASYDEWVEDQRVRVPGTGPRVTPRTSTIEILWGGRWWKGTVLAKKSGLIKIHYAGWSNVWDQWVEPTRVRPLAP